MPRQQPPIRGVDWDDIIHAHESSNYTRALKEGATTWIKGRCVKLSRDQRPVQWQGQVVIQVEGRDIVTDDDVVATYPLGKVFKKLFPIYATFQVGSELRDDRTGERLEEFPMRCSGQRRMHVEPRTRDVDMIRRGTRRVRPGCDENFVLRVVAFKVDQENQVEIIGGWIE